MIAPANSNSIFIERRNARRFDVRWDVIVRQPDASGFDEPGTLVNLSSRGALVRLRRNPDLHTKLDLWVRLPLETERWMKYSAEVVRVEGPAPFSVALRFNRVRPQFAEGASALINYAGSFLMNVALWLTLAGEFVADAF